MNIQLSILQFFQGVRSPILDAIFLIFTISTELPVIVLFTTLMYWCLNKEYGQKILFSLIGNITVNTGIKEFFKAPRPIGTKGIKSMRVSTATGYSFPSGHTQSATSFWVSLITIFKTSWVTLIGITMILGVGISRLYLAVHWPIDVLCGWIFGIIFAILFGKIFDYVHKNKKYWILFLILGLFALGLFLVNSETYIKVLGLLSGFVLGYIVEDNFIKFETNDNNKGKINFSNKKNNIIKINIFRFLIGIITLGSMYLGLKYTMPEGDIFNYIRYTILVFYGTAGVPALFKLFKLDKKY